MADPDQPLSEAQAAAALRVAGKTLARWRQAGRGPAYLRTPTGRISYQWADLIAFRRAMIVTPDVLKCPHKSGESDAVAL